VSGIKGSPANSYFSFSTASLDRRYPLFRDGGVAQIDHPSRDPASRRPGSRTPTRREFSFLFRVTQLRLGRNLTPLTRATTRQLFYFSRAAHDWPTGIVAPSPVLERLGLYKAEEQPKEPVSGLGELFEHYGLLRALHSGFLADPGENRVYPSTRQAQLGSARVRRRRVQQGFRAQGPRSQDPLCDGRLGRDNRSSTTECL
jgi:hypothetical protein